MRKRWLATGIAVYLSITLKTGEAAILRPETLKAWNEYIQMTNDHMTARLTNSHEFLWADEDASRVRRLKEGQIQALAVDRRGPKHVANGLIHDWVGGIFIPKTSLEQVVRTLRAYDQYKHFYRPEIIESKTIKRTEDGDEFTMRWINKVLAISTGIDTDCKIQNVRVDDHRFYRISQTTKVREIQNYGRPNEREFAADQGNGFLWRLFSITRVEERDGGTFVEIEAVALTRNIPGSLRLLVGPLVTRLSRNALLVSLRQTGAAVGSSHEITADLAHGAGANRVSTLDTRYSRFVDGERIASDQYAR